MMQTILRPLSIRKRITARTLCTLYAVLSMIHIRHCKKSTPIIPQYRAYSEICAHIMQRLRRSTSSTRSPGIFSGLANPIRTPCKTATQLFRSTSASNLSKVVTIALILRFFRNHPIFLKKLSISTTCWKYLLTRRNLFSERITTLPESTSPKHPVASNKYCKKPAWFFRTLRKLSG